MKRKIWFTGFWKSFNIHDNMFTNILKKQFEIFVTNDDPDFLICSPLGRPYEYMNFDCPRIMFTGEFLSADFNAIDYFIGFDRISFADRNFRFPLFLYTDDGNYKTNNCRTIQDAKQILAQKKYFCNYIFGHDTALGKREAILRQLQNYKRVECAGKHFNNMPDGKIYTIRTKPEIIKLSKFTITAESVCYPGFTSEKILDAFRSLSIPIYYGDPLISSEINPNAFVNCYEYDSIEDAVEKVVEIDKDDNLYTKMLCEPWYLENNYENNMYSKLENYLWKIVSQSREEAYRRPRFYRAGWHETYLREYNRYMLSWPHRILKKIGL